MKFRNKGLFCFIFFLLIVLFTGCGKTSSPDKVLENIKASADKKLPTQKSIMVSFQAAYQTNISGIEISADVKNSMYSEEFSNESSFETYQKSELTTEYLDESYDYTNEAYRVKDETEAITSYHYHGLSDEWSREETGTEPKEYYETVYIPLANLELNFETAVLEEETTVLEGQEAYIVKTECSGDDLYDLLKYSGFLDEMNHSISREMLENISIPMTGWFDAKTYFPLQIEAEKQSFGELIKRLLEAELQDVTVQMNECSFLMKDFSYESKSIPAVPEHAKTSFSINQLIELMGCHTFPDLTEVLQSGSKAARLDPSVLKDYKYYDYRTGKYMTLVNMADETKLVHFEAMPESVARQYFKDTEKYLKSFLKENDVDVSAEWRMETVDTHLGEADVYCMNAQDQLSVFHTVIVTDHISICIAVFDFAGEWYDPAPVIEHYASAITEITAETLPFMLFTFDSDYEGMQLSEAMTQAVGEQQVSSAEIYFAEWGIFIQKEDGAIVQAADTTELLGKLLTSNYVEYNDRVSLGFYDGKEMYNMTVCFSGKAFLDILKFCSPALLDKDTFLWEAALEDKVVNANLIVDSKTKLPAAVMFDISEINTLLLTDRNYLVMDKLQFEY